jgi:hypothetical protein
MNRMNRVIVAVLLLSVSHLAYGQNARSHSFTAKLEGVAVLKDIEADPFDPQVLNLEAPNPDGNIDKMKLRDAKLESAQRFSRRMSDASRTARKTTAAPSPIVAQNFVADSFVGIPPDNDMAISRSNKIVNVLNSRITVLDGQGGAMSMRVDLKSFSQKVGLNSILNDYRYDPKVLYDAEADRYICVMLNSTNRNNFIVIGFTLSNDPEGAWSFYKFPGDYKNDTTWFDYPAIAITDDEIFLTGNKIKDNVSWQLGFSETVIYQINKWNGYDSAATLNYKIWDGINFEGRPIRNLFPVKAGWLPDGNEQYFLSNRNFDVQNDTIFLVKVPGTITNGGNLTIQALKSPVPYGVPPNGRQPDTSVVLATNDGRVLGAYANAEEIQFVSTSIDTNTGSSAIYHGKISNYRTSPAVSYAQFISVDTLDFGYPNISFVGNGWGLNQSIITFNYTGPNDHPGLSAVLYDAKDYSDIIRVKTGEGSIKRLGGKEQRWGDYTGSQVDFNSFGSVWIVGIYGRADSHYGNWIAKLNSPVLGVKETTVSREKGIVYPNPVNTYLSYSFTLQEEAPVHFTIYDINGRKVHELMSKNCKKGKNLIQFNTASLPAGTYILKGAYAEGREVMAERFVKQ